MIGVVELPGDPVRRRLRDRDAGQVIEVAHVGAGQFQLEVGTTEGQRIGQCTRQADTRGAVDQLEVNRVGVLGVAQRKKRTANELARDRLAGIGALGAHRDLRRWRCRASSRRRLPCRDPQREIGLQSWYNDMRLTVGDAQIADLRRRRRGCAVEGQGVIGFSVRGLQRLNLGPLQYDLRQYDLAGPDVGHHVGLHAHPCNPGEIPLLRKVGRIGDPYVIGAHRRNPPELHVQMFDRDPAAERGCGLALHDRNQPIPVPERDQRCDCRRHCDDR